MNERIAVGETRLGSSGDLRASIRKKGRLKGRQVDPVARDEVLVSLGPGPYGRGWFCRKVCERSLGG